MASIVGLDEQKAALNRVKDCLNQVDKINNSISNLKDYIEQAVTKAFVLECKFVLPDETLHRIKVPVKIDDGAFIFNALKEQKAEIVKQIKDDTSKYRIMLSDQEEASLSDIKTSEN